MSILSFIRYLRIYSLPFKKMKKIYSQRRICMKPLFKFRHLKEQKVRMKRAITEDQRKCHRCGIKGHKKGFGVITDKWIIVDLTTANKRGATGCFWEYSRRR
jgi:hypothetical protein